jgi:hypothetical protein
MKEICPSEFFQDKNFNLNEIISLTNLSFQKKNYIKNFPQVFKTANKEFLFLIKYNNIPVAFCSLFGVTFQIEKNTLIGYCIGSVCTHPNFRNLGLAKKILALAEKHAYQKYADFVFLFSEKVHFYSQLNYVQAGKVSLAQFSKKSTQPKGYHNLEQLQKLTSNIDFLKNYTLFYRKNAHDLLEEEKRKIWSFIIQKSIIGESILSYLEFSDIIKIKQMSIYYLLKKDEIKCVCFFNKGDDFENVVHSTYYEKKDYILYIIKEILKKKKEVIFFTGPLYKDFESHFMYENIPCMFLKTFNEKKLPNIVLQNLCIKNKIFVRSLQGT